MTILMRDPDLLTKTWLDTLLEPIRDAVAFADGPALTSAAVAAALRGRLPSPDILTAEQRLGSPDGYRQHVLHVEPGGEFSILALVWRPGQRTQIHDHVCWCASAVITGTEHEVLFAEQWDQGVNRLIEIGERHSRPGDVSGFAPPGDIHFVENDGPEIAIALHVYGTDISAVGTSVRRTYESV